jgi:hypothetical protein
MLFELANRCRNFDLTIYHKTLIHNNMESFVKVKSEESFMKDIENLIDRKFSELYSNTSDPLLTRKETARFLKKSLTWLDNMRRDGRIHPLSIGGAVYYKMSEIDRALNNGRV